MHRSSTWLVSILALWASTSRHAHWKIWLIALWLLANTAGPWVQAIQLDAAIRSQPQSPIALPDAC
jgi:hypothetical protein